MESSRENTEFPSRHGQETGQAQSRCGFCPGRLCSLSNLESGSVPRRLSIDESVREESLISVSSRSASLFSRIPFFLYGWSDDRKSRMLKWPSEFEAALPVQWPRKCGWSSQDRGYLAVCMPELPVLNNCVSSDWHVIRKVLVDGLSDSCLIGIGHRSFSSIRCQGIRQKMMSPNVRMIPRSILGRQISAK